MTSELPRTKYLEITIKNLEAEIERLRAEVQLWKDRADSGVADRHWHALNEIADLCPATTEMTLAHEMAQIAVDALKGEKA